MVLVSVDDHVVEPPHLFEGRLPAKYADLAPKFITRDDGTDVWVYEGQELANVALNAVVGPPARGVRHRAHLVRPAPHGLLRRRRAGQGHERQRRARLAVLPVVPAVLRPALRPHRGQGRRPGDGPGLQRLAHRRVVRHPPRPLHPVRRCPPSGTPRSWPPRSAASPPRAATPSRSPRTPRSSGWPSIHSDHWDPFWQACSDEDVVVCLHIGSSSALVITVARRPDRLPHHPDAR